MIRVEFNESKENNTTFDSCTVITECNGLRKKKVVSIDNFIEVIQKSIISDLKGNELGDMPKGYDGANIVSINPLIGTVRIKLPASIRRVIYEDTTFNIPFPELLFEISVHDGIQNTSLFPIVKNEKYLYPFGNVSNDGKVCWGSNKIRRMKVLKDTEVLPVLFFNAPGNADYYHASRTKMNFDNIRNLYEFLDGKEAFPTEILTKCNCNKSNY